MRNFPLEAQGKKRMDKTQLELIRGTLDVLILKALVWGPLHGYAVTSLIRRQTDEALLVEEGTLYPALWRLESKGLVDAEWGLSENNRKAKYYRLTSEGRRYLRQETKTWEAYADGGGQDAQRHAASRGGGGLMAESPSGAAMRACSAPIRRPMWTTNSASTSIPKWTS